MIINRVRYLKGPNYFAYTPTICIELDIGELEEKPSDTIPGFNEKLLKILPNIGSHTCSKGYRGGFAERLRNGTWMAHILEHMTIELQNLAGIDAIRGKTIMMGKKGHYYVTYDYQEQECGLQAFLAAKEIAEAILNDENHINVQLYVKQIEQIYYQNKLGPSTEAIFKAAQAKNIPVERMGDDSLLRLGTGSRQKYVQATISSQTSNIAVENSCDKSLTKAILKGCGLPVPEGEIAHSIEDIFDSADRLGFPLVIKPYNGRQGQGVITHIKNKDELFNVINCLESHVEKYIVERHFEGHDYRLLIVNGELIASSLRLPPYVIGNGKETIRRLIEKENRNTLRGEGHEKPMSKIPLTHTVTCYLEKSNRTLNTIPKEGELVQVVGNANLSTGGKAIDVTDQIHPTIKNMAVAAARAIGLDIAGIDFICEDISKPIDHSRTAIIEVNAAPGIRMHHYPSEGEKRDVGKAIVDYLFPTREEGAIPIIAVTGTNGKTTTTRLVHYFLSNEKTKVGMTNSDGVYIGDEVLDQGDCSGPISARMVLAHPEVDLAVLETARGGILREGLAFRQCDVGIITNVSEDHLGNDGIDTLEDLVKLKRLVAEIVLKTGYCILNADDPNVAAMEAYTDGQVIYTSTDATQPLVKAAINEGCKVWYVNEQGMILHASDGIIHQFMDCNKIPITISGMARHNIANLLQALAAAHTQGISMEELRKKAVSFMPDTNLSKGRFNLKKLKERTIIIDYAHNEAGLKAIFETVSAYNRNRLITVLAGPGDRIDEELIRLSKVAAMHSDLFIIKEDDDLRGREPFEVAKLLQEAAIEEGLHKDRTCLVLNELDAFVKAWETSQPGDLLLFFYTDFGYVERFFEKVSKDPLPKK
ncbi:Cyanophycin synthetase [Peribacillus sp. Bi96]|uniref:cyanophycin synthetase n=1 Tax=Peribacillus sp. Bi96 TaxID=2884273 RepID=UPI001DAC41AB|nr:cyanophycin synthetase [Peribacillus sp. Bi96]CAH0205270.1 Cyanophycin synthetase [Peribacillus sp. Bi96]